MAAFQLPTDAASSQNILHHLLEDGVFAGRDAGTRTVITVAVNDWRLERMLASTLAPKNTKTAAMASRRTTRSGGSPPSVH
jgi:hypothetical protein